MLVALLERFSRRATVPPEKMWAYLDRREAPPDDLRRAIVDEFFPLVSPDDFLLPSSEDASTIRTMSTVEIAEPRRGRPVRGKKLAEALTKAGVTLSEIADAAKRSTASVRSWSYPKTDDNMRPAPREVVEMFRDEYGIPLSVWTKIVG